MILLFSILINSILLFGAVDTTSNTLGVDKVVINEVKKTKRELDQSEMKKRKVKSMLYQLNHQIKSASKKHENLSHKIYGTKSKVKNVARKILELKKNLNQKKRYLSNKLRTAYYLKGSGAVKLLLNDPSRFDKNLLILKRLVVEDKNIIAAFQENLKELESQNLKLKEKVRELSFLKVKMKKAEKNLEGEQKKKVSFLTKLRKIEEVNRLKIKNLRKNFLADTELNEIIKITFFEKKGQLELPVEGEVIEAFGIIDDYDYNIRFMNKGWSVNSSLNATVKSIFSGRISFTGEIMGHGKSVIIDHGDHYYSVYTHLNKVFVKKDHKVNQGQKIGILGWNKNLKRASLYFELRHYSEPLDPKNWFKNVQLHHANQKLNKTSGEKNEKKVL